MPDDDKPMPPVMLRKSSGAHLYHSTDLATIKQRMEEYNPDEMWYFTDARQASTLSRSSEQRVKPDLSREDNLPTIPLAP